MTTDAERPSVLAVFDFDGTLTSRDTSLPFILFVTGTARGWWHVARLAPWYAIDLLDAVWRERAGTGEPPDDARLGSVRGRWETNVHERTLEKCFAGMPVADLRAQGDAFAQSQLPGLVRPAGMRRLEWHKSKGHRCVLISASIDVYLRPWAAAVGFDDVVATRLEVDHDVVTGRFSDEPCWGRAKVRRLEAHLGLLDDYTVYAYGDSRGDRDLLARADHGFWVREVFPRDP